MTSDTELQHQSELADAELGVAEELGWAVAVLSGLAAHFKWDSWLLTLPITIGSYVLATYRYRRKAAKAEDDYYQAAGLGIYALKRGSDDS